MKPVMKLFCFPYAGASAMIYNKWKAHMAEGIELIPVELAGRGKYFGTPFYDSFEDMIEDVYSKIESQLDDSPYAIFGHSMGSWIAYDLAHKISELKRPMPEHIFFSGRRAPHIESRRTKYYELPDDEFLDEIYRLGGTPKELLENKELLMMFLPVLRTDFRLVDLYRYEERPCKLSCNISILSGEEDAISLPDLHAWEEHSSADCTVHMLPGGHFFINEQTVQVTDILNRTLTRTLARQY